MANAFQEAQKQVMQALALLDQAGADELVGESTEEYKTLVNGMNGAYQMLWTMVISNGLRTNQAVKKMGGQAQLTMLTLIHYAYALGIRQGKEK